ncbi:MAG: DEAD/DEAH box helicase family protein [Porticoccaceae bacterium]
MFVPRYYQEDSVQGIFDYFAEKDGNPLVVLPTGAGKSLVMAMFVRRAIESYPSTRIVILTHVKELIQQDAQAIIRHWPQAPIGIWSASIGKKMKQQVTVAGIQSIHRLAPKFAGTDLVLIDEAHLISKNADTMYGRFINGLRAFNPHLKVIGLTATPYRMDSGLLTEGKNRIFTDIAYEISVGTLIKEGYLCPLFARRGATEADLSAVHTRGGEFVSSELNKAMDKECLIKGALNEIASLAHDRKHILGFCAGMEHSRHCAEIARDMLGWSADYVTSEMSAGDRDARINAFKEGRTRILFNAMLLTTGFDAPQIDAIAMLRPTKSTGLYVQIMGRGLRKHDSKENTLILDFAGNVERHGPIDQIKVKSKAEKGEGVSVAPVKECPNCSALVFAGASICPECEYQFPVNEAAKHGTEAADAVVIAAIEKPREYQVDRVEYERHVKAGKAPSVKVTYHCGISTFSEWLPIEDPRSFVRKHAVQWLWSRGFHSAFQTVDEFLDAATHNRIPAPDSITVKMDGKYWRVQSSVMGACRMDVSTVVERVAATNWRAFA